MAYNFNTFGDTVTEAYNELSVDSSTVTVPGLELTQMEKWGNRYHKEFVEKVHLKTQYDTYSFRTRGDSSISADASSGAVSLTLADTVTTLGYPTSGMILLDGIPYTYSNFVSYTMTVEALDRAYSAGDEVRLGYAVPTNFGKPVSLYVEGGTDMVPRISPLRYEYQKWGIIDDIAPSFYSVFNDFIFLPRALSSSGDVTLHYYKKATNTLTTGSTMEIYQMWDAYVIFKLTARGHRLLFDQGRAQEYEALAKDVMNRAKAHVAQEDISATRGFVPGW